MIGDRSPRAKAVSDHHYVYSSTEILLPYQRYWIADTSPLKIAEKSRRTGITWAEACDAALTAALSKDEGGENYFYVGSNKEMAREFIEAVAMWAKAFGKSASEVSEEVINDDGKDILTFVVYFASTLKVQALSSNPSNLRGMQGCVGIDEAAFHERLAEVLKAALALTMWGAKVRIISTHNGIDNIFNNLIQDSRAGKKRYSIHTITLADACADGLYKRICQTKKEVWTQEKEDQWVQNLLKDTATEEDALEEYFCVPKSGSGVYIPRSYRERAAILDNNVIRFNGTAQFNAKPERHRELDMIEWLEQNVQPHLDALPKHLRHTLGEDFARSCDLTVFAPCTVQPNTKREIPFLVELFNTPFKQQEQVLYYIADRLPRRDGIKLDGRGNGEYLAEQAVYKYGAEVEKVMLSSAYYRENMPRFKAAFEDEEILIPKNEDVINDFSSIQIIRGVPSIDDKRTKSASGGQRHGDSAIAIFLAYLASKEDCRRYELHRIVPDKYNSNNDDRSRQFKLTRGLRGQRGLL